MTGATGCPMTECDRLPDERGDRLPDNRATGCLTTGVTGCLTTGRPAARRPDRTTRLIGARRPPNDGVVRLPVDRLG
jgi:hypothetical protein